MGKNKRHRKANPSKRNRDVDNRDKRQQGQGEAQFDKLVKNNAAFEKYYQAQNLMPSDEFEQFLETLRLTLPASFRITASRRYAVEILKVIKNVFVPKLTNIVYNDGQVFKAPEPLHWYPDEFAWQHTVSRNMLKKASEFAEFHSWLVTETGVGNISRQEAVSMIPPLLLDVKPEHWVLDMCAAPGSKTAQLMEAIHANDTLSRDIPAGLVVANDVDSKRAYTLVHQTKRLRSPCLVVTNHEASSFPGIYVKQADDEKPKPIQFDRVLADVPCSGDGTLRKNVLLWKKWSVVSGIGLHRMQVKILARGAQLVKVGGRLVYSTCSFNPVENEAVVAEVLRRCKGSLRLVDVSDQLPLLKRAPGLSTWKVMNKVGKFLSKWEDAHPSYRGKFERSLWPPPNVDELHLDRCIRVYPHYQNTGGFFIAVFEKTGPITDVTTKSDDKHMENEKEETVSFSGETTSVPEDMSAAPEEIENDNIADYELIEIGESDLISSTDITDSNDPAEIPDVEDETLPQKRVNADSSDIHNKRLKVDNIQTSKQTEKSTNQNDSKGQKRGKSGISYEEQFIFLEPDNEDLSVIKSYYSLSPEFPSHLFLVRSENAKNRTLYFVSLSVRSLLTSPDASRLRVINTGLRVLTKQDVPEEVKCSYRLHSEGVAVIAPWMEGEERVVRGEMEDLEVLLSEQTPRFEKFRDEMKEKLLAIEQGCILFIVLAPLQASTSTVPLPPIILPIWRGRSSLNLLYKKEERHALELRIQNYMGKPIGNKADPKKADDQNSSIECKEVERNTADEQVKKDTVEP